jgi:hypothetical protein
MRMVDTMQTLQCRVNCVQKFVSPGHDANYWAINLAIMGAEQLPAKHYLSLDWRTCLPNEMHKRCFRTYIGTQNKQNAAQITQCERGIGRKETRPPRRKQFLPTPGPGTGPGLLKAELTQATAGRCH